MPEIPPNPGLGAQVMSTKTSSVGVEARPAHPYRLTVVSAALVCALTPAYTVRWHYGPLPTTLLELAISVTVGVFAVETQWQRMRLEWRTPFTIPATIFLIAGAISVLIAPDRIKALGLYRAYLIEPIVFFYIVSAAARTRRRASLILAGLGLAGLAVAVPNAVVVLQAMRHHTLNVAVAPPVVIYMSPNSLALFLVPLIGVSAALLFYSWDRQERLGAAVFLAIAGIATLLSFSRGGYLALAAMALTLALTHGWRRVLVPAVLLLGIAVSRIPPVASRIGHEVDFRDPNNSLDERFRLWGATARMLRDHPVFGTGLSSFRQSIGPYRQGSFTEDLIYPHNIVLNFWTETGLLGVAAVAWILVAAFQLTWRGWRRLGSEWRALHLGVFLALIGIVGHGLVDVPYWKNDLSVEFWALLGLVWAGTQLDRREIQEPSFASTQGPV